MRNMAAAKLSQMPLMRRSSCPLCFLSFLSRRAMTICGITAKKVSNQMKCSGSHFR